MPRMVTRFAAGQDVEILMGDDKDHDWRRGTIHKVVAIRLYQVNIPGYGYLMKREHELREVRDEAGA